MSYEADLTTAQLWEKVRVFMIIVAVAILGVTLVTDKMPWLHFVRAGAWVLAGIAGILEGRALKRLGRDPDSSYLRGVLCIVVAVICVL
jgi:hypothetical protein